MKKLLRFAFIIAIAAAAACEGPEGPPGPEGTPGAQGPQGPQGPAGPAATARTGQVLDIGGWDFTEENEYFLGIEFEDFEMEVVESDIVMVYRLHNVYEGNGGQGVAVWRPLPQFMMFEEGMLKYDFLHSYEFMAIFMSSQLDMSELGEGWTMDQVFRIVVVTGEPVNGRSSGTDLSELSYEEVIRHYKINDENVPRFQYKSN